LQTESLHKQFSQLKTGTRIFQLTPKFFFPSHEALKRKSQLKFCGWTSYGSLQAWSTAAAVSIQHLLRIGPKIALQCSFSKTSGREQQSPNNLTSTSLVG